MHLFLYEWITGGGLVDHHGPLPESLAREGRAMVEAVAADAVAAGWRVTMLRDMRFANLVGRGAEMIEVSSRATHDAEFEQHATEADATLLIAPETDGDLLRLARSTEAIGATLASPSPEFIEATSDKERAARVLSDSGLPTAEAIRIDPDTPLPVDFPYPAVLKPLDGAGSQDTHLVAQAGDRPPAYAWPRRLERLVPGAPVSVAVIGKGRGEPICLPPCRQRIADDGRFTYLGGSTPLPEGLAARAKRLALASVAALPSLTGYADVDMVLGGDPDDAEDAILEVNPRLTTSYVGLRRATKQNLAAVMLASEAPNLEFDPRPLAFEADGAVYWEHDA